MKGTIRKIIVGDNYTHNIKYVKGTEYRVGATKCKITDFLETKSGIDIYVTDGNSTFLWKTIIKEPLEIEYDANFS
tara:strand:- start:5192 stop:5419 length:228 start_codon:yes stop_codon:yes gene_type:complete